MFIDKDSIKIDNVSVGQYITSAKYNYNKLWSSDSGRNLAGKMTGSLVGIFPKIELQFRPLTKSELELLVPIFDKANQTVSYYDPYKKAQINMTTYTGDWAIENQYINQNEGFSISFIATQKRR